MRRSLPLLLVLPSVLLAGCPGDKVDMCGQDVEKRGLADLLYSWYLYPDLLPPVVDTSQYASSQDLLDGMTKAARDLGEDRGWTYVTTAQDATAFFEEGKTVGIGVGLVARPPDVFIGTVYPGSPAAAAGFQRGDKLLQIGATEATLQPVTSDNVGGLFGPATAGLTRVVEVLPAGGGAPVVRTATKATLDLDPVPAVVEIAARHGLWVHVDAALAPLLDRVRSDPSRPWIVAVTGDHGEGLGDHGERTHGILLYGSTTEVPLILWPARGAPARAAGQNQRLHSGGERRPAP